jgi:hypothetical protein
MEAISDMVSTYETVEAKKGITACAAVGATIGQTSLPVMFVRPHVIIRLRYHHAGLVGWV